jgi:IS1 family transposase
VQTESRASLNPHGIPVLNKTEAMEGVVDVRTLLPCCPEKRERKRGRSKSEGNLSPLVLGGRYLTFAQPVLAALVWREGGKPVMRSNPQVFYRQIAFSNPRLRSADVGYLAFDKPPVLPFVADRNPANNEFRSEASLDRASGFNRLPHDCTQGEDQRPRSNTFGPCYEFVPPLRLILAIGCLAGAVAINGYGHGWIRLLCLLPAFCTGLLILGGHKYWCQDNNREYEYDPNVHSGTIVPQKYILTTNNKWGTVIDMANVLDKDKQIAVIGALAEGSSIRSIERVTGVHRDTITRLGVKVGQGCAALLDTTMRNLPCNRLELDEIWGFVGKKDRSVREGEDGVGSVWTFCAIDAETKLVPTFKVGNRDAATAKAFVQDIANRVAYRVQISTDGLTAYVPAIESAFGADVDYAQIIKVYGHEEVSNNRRYSAPEFVSSEKKVIVGNPDERLISTSYIERLNATTRLHMRRLTRLTLAFSKKRENFEAAVALHFAYYNFVKRHNTIRCTPAMAAGVTGSFWSVGQLVEAAA